MGSNTSGAEPRAVPLAEFATEIDRRRAETGVVEMPRNSNERRTPSKRALLKAVEAAGGKW